MARKTKPHGGAREGAGRPPIHDEPMGVRLTFRLPQDLAEALDEYAARHGVSHAQAARDLLERALRRSGDLTP